MRLALSIFILMDSVLRSGWLAAASGLLAINLLMYGSNYQRGGCEMLFVSLSAILWGLFSTMHPSFTFTYMSVWKGRNISYVTSMQILLSCGDYFHDTSFFDIQVWERVKGDKHFLCDIYADPTYLWWLFQWYIPLWHSPVWACKADKMFLDWHLIRSYLTQQRCVGGDILPAITIINDVKSWAGYVFVWNVDNYFAVNTLRVALLV